MIAPFLERHQVFDTNKTEHVESLLAQAWQATSFSTEKSNKKFRAIGRKRQLDRLGMAFCFYSNQSEADCGGIPLLRQQFAIDGNSTTRIGRKKYTVDPSTSCVLPPDRESTLGFGKNYQQIIVRIAPSTLESTLTNMIGALPRGGLRFTDTAVTGAHFAQLRRFVLLLADEASRPETPPLFLRELEDAFLAQFLLANNHSQFDGLRTTSASAPPRYVYLVEDFIRAHWHEPLTMEKIAEVTGVSARSIYAAFREHRGYGPKAFLRQTRLNQARLLLSKGTRDISSVAKLCGFSNAGHFARYYRSAFGELPSNTGR